MKKTNIRGRSAASTTRGLSLIELLIALALGTVLLLGLVEIFSGVRVSFGSAESLSRVQENGRFAMEFMRRDIRMGGHFGCRSLNEVGHVLGVTDRRLEPALFNHFIESYQDRDLAPYTLRVDVPFEVYDYTGTAPGDSFTIASSDPTPPGSAANWTPALPAGLDATDDVLPGSDVIVVRYLDADTYTITAANAVSGLITVAADDAPNILAGAVYGMTNCRSAAIFQVNSRAGNVLNVAGEPNFNRKSPDDVDLGWWDDSNLVVGQGSMLFRYQVVAYYIGNGVNGPALMRKTLPANGNAAALPAQVVFAPAEEIVEGVEMLQVVLGVDSDRNDAVNRYVGVGPYLDGLSAGAEQEAALRAVASMRVSLLIRGNNSRAGAESSASSLLVGEVRVTPPADGRLRQVYDSNIALRNRLGS